MNYKWMKLIILLSLALTATLLITHGEDGGSGDLVIANTTTLRNRVLTIQGSLIIEPGGKLILENSTIILDETKDFQYNVTVKGELDLNDNSKINTTSGYKYTVYVDNGTLTINNSALENIGGNSGPGISASGESPRLEFHNALITYKGYYMKILVHVDTKTDGVEATLGRLSVNGLRTQSEDGNVPQNYMIKVEGDTVFSITGVDFLDGKLTGWSDIFISYSASTTRIPSNITLNLTSSKADTIKVYSYKKLNLRIHNVTGGTLTVSGSYNVFLNASVTNSTFTGKIDVDYSELYARDLNAQSIKAENTNVTIIDSAITNPGNDGVYVYESLKEHFSINLTNVKIINVTQGYYYGEQSGVKIHQANRDTEVHIKNLTVTRKPGEEGVPGIYIGDVKGAEIHVSDSEIPGIEISTDKNFFDGGMSERVNLYLSNVKSSLDGKPIVVYRGSSSSKLSGSYAQIFIYNCSNIEVGNMSFTESIPNPLVIAGSSDIKVSNITTNNSVFHAAILVLDSRNIDLEGLRINSSTTSQYTRSIALVNASDVTLNNSEIWGGSDYQFANALLISYSTLEMDKTSITSTVSNSIAVQAIKYSTLSITDSNITSASTGIKAAGSTDISPPQSLSIYHSSVTAGYRAVVNDNRLIIQSSNLTVETESPRSSSYVLALSHPRYLLVNASKLESTIASGYIDSIVYLDAGNAGNLNLTLTGNNLTGPAKYGIYVASFTNASSSLVIKDNSLQGQIVSILLKSSEGASVTDNRITSGASSPGGIVLKPSSIGQTLHEIQGNLIDGRPITYLYRDTAIGLHGFGQIIAVMSHVEAENTGITGYPGVVQLYSSTMTVKNASITAPYSDNGALDSYERQDAPVFKTEYSSTLTIEGSRINAKTSLILFEVELNGGTGEGLVLNNTRIEGTAYRLVDTTAQVSIGIYNSVINWNATIEGSLNHEITRMYCNTGNPGLEFDLVNTRVTIASGKKFDLEQVRRVYWKNVTVESSSKTGISDNVLILKDVRSARIDDASFIGVPGVHIERALVYVTGGGVYNITNPAYAGLLDARYYTSRAFIDGVVFNNVTGKMIYVYSSSGGEFGLANIGLDATVSSSSNSYFLSLMYRGTVYTGNLVANHSTGTPIYVNGGTLYMHYSSLTNNTCYGLRVQGGAVNATHNYWGDSNGPVFTESCDAKDPEEVYNTTTIYYRPPLVNLPRENDTTPPTVSITSPADNAVLKGLAWFNVSYSDDYGVMAVVILVDEQPAAILFEGNNSARIDTSIFKDGNHTIYAIAYDYAGHTSIVSIGVEIENSKPSANITEPINNSIVSGYLTIRYYVYDDNLDTARLYANNTVISSTTRTGYTSYTLNTKSYSDGPLWLKVTAVDEDGQTSEYRILVTIDNTPPSLIVDTPGNNSYIRGTRQVKFSTHDRHPKEYRIYLNGTLIENDTSTGTITYNLDTTRYQDGRYNLTIYTVDRAGNANATTRFITIDNTPPSATIQSPSNGQDLTGTVNITVDASDAIGLRYVTIYINGTLVFNKTVDPDNPTDPTYTYEWDTTKYQDGTYNITTVVYDLAGNTDTDQKTVQVLNAQPVPESGLLALVALAIALLVLLAKTRRNR
ncbi:MAG: Ig-like domain-containing protein [Desulfurococcales archaeon]|nr:Ig-like domain-containing protein [Desulfurococcales archaeon]